MNTTHPHATASLFKALAAIGRVQHRVGEMSAGVMKATAAFFSRRRPVSSMQVTWAGVLRSECDRLIPEASEEVRFQVANQMFLCDAGKPLVFDDTWNQDAWQQMNGYRVEFSTDSTRSPKVLMRHRLQHFITKLVRR